MGVEFIIATARAALPSTKLNDSLIDTNRCEIHDRIGRQVDQVYYLLELGMACVTVYSEGLGFGGFIWL